MRRKSYIVTFVVLVAVLAIFSGVAEAVAYSLSVGQGEDVTRPVDLAVEDHVLIDFSVAGGEIKTVSFSVTCPNGTTTDFGEQGKFSYNFVCTDKGQYVLHFVNNDQTSDKIVALELGVEHYVFGMTTNMFWLVLIALVCVVGAVCYVIVTRPSY